MACDELATTDSIDVFRLLPIIAVFGTVVINEFHCLCSVLLLSGESCLRLFNSSTIVTEPDDDEDAGGVSFIGLLINELDDTFGNDMLSWFMFDTCFNLRFL